MSMLKTDPAPCSNCSGTGHLGGDLLSPHVCPTCKGFGEARPYATAVATQIAALKVALRANHERTS